MVGQVASARAVQAFLPLRSNIRSGVGSSLHRWHLRNTRVQSRARLRYASSSQQPPSTSPQSSKPTVLEKPDKFRPPSHGSRRNARSTTAMYGAGAAYNQGMNERERQASQTKSYPHMFPNEGTTMHWFLTTRWVHVTITMVSVVSTQK